MPVKKYFLFIILFFSIGRALAQESERAVIPHVSPTIKFTENNGKWDDHVLMRATLPGGALFIEKATLSYNFFDQKKLMALHTGGLANGKCKDFTIGGHAYKVIFENARPQPTLHKMQKGSD